MKNSFSIAFIILLTVLFMTVCVCAESFSNVVKIGELTGGLPKGVFVTNGYAYVAAGGILSILNISDPSNPVQVGIYDTAEDAQGVFVSGNYAYVVEGLNGLQVIDISTPSSPSEVGSYNTPGNAHDVFVSGNYAYIADWNSGLRVIDISTPSSPNEVGFYDTSGSARGVYVSGNYAYVADNFSGLQIIDISTPSSPSWVGLYNTSGSAAGVYVSGNYAYVAGGSSGLQVIAISNPSSPSEVGSYNTPGWAHDVFVSGNYAYVADDLSGLRVIVISNPSSPSGVGLYNTPGYAYRVFVRGNYAYVADDVNGLRVIDISTSASPNEVSFYDTPGDARGVYVSGNYAYVGDGASGLRVIDISTPSSPSEVGSYNTPGDARGVYVSGNYVYVGDGARGLRVIDISTPSSPSEVGFYNTPGYAHGVFVNGNYAYVADYNTGLRVIAISNPSSPHEVGFYDTSGNASDVFVSGNYAYVADFTSGLRVIAISNPSSPSEVGFYDTSGNSYGVYVSGNYAYVADGSDGLRVIDISTPSSPSEVGFYNTPGNSYGVYVSGNYAYIADGDNGLRVIDISTPSSPSEVGFYNTPGNSFGVYGSGNNTYIADKNSGIYILKPFIPTTPSWSAVTGITPTGFTVSWNDSSNEDNYNYILSNTVTGSIVSNLQLAADTTSKAQDGLANNTRYSVKIYASNTMGVSTTIETNATTLLGIPSAPSNVIADTATPTNCILHWIDMSSGGSQEDNFIVYQNTNAVFSGASALATLAADITNYTVTGLSAHTIYYFWVRATNTTGSAMSSSNSITTLFDPPAAPTGLHAEGIAQTNLVLYWIDNSLSNSMEEAFIVYQNTSNAFATANRIATTAADATNLSVIGLTSNTRYYFWVEASNADARNLSAGYAVATLPGIPSAPSNVIADTATSTNCILHWADMSSGNTQEDNFIVYQNTANNFSAATALATLAADTTNYTVTGLKAKTIYYFWVRAINQTGSATGTVCMVTTSNAAVANSSTETSVGPNPGKNGESMTFGPLPKNVRIEIYDALGNQVNNIDVPENQPSYIWTLKNSDDETIAPGIYFTRIINTDDESDYKIIKLAVVR